MSDSRLMQLRVQLGRSSLARATVDGMHRAGPGERGGGSYGRRAVAAAKGAAMQISRWTGRG